MNLLKFYRNTGSLSNYRDITEIATFEVTPKNMDIPSGYIDLQITFDEINSVNYLSYTRESKTIYAWITNIEERSGNKLFRIFYKVDPYRTYKSKLNIGSQFILRESTPTKIYDPLLSSTREAPNVLQEFYSIGDPTLRYCIVQESRPSTSDSNTLTPVQPTPYRFWICPYEANDWRGSPVDELMQELGKEAKPTNIVTVYSLPYFNMTGMSVPGILNVKTTGDTFPIDGFYPLSTNIKNRVTNFTKLTLDPNLNEYGGDVYLIFPEAGIMKVPRELYGILNLGVRQDIDIFSGACNYMLATDGGATPYNVSVRGSAIASMTIVSDPMDTYLSQNQSALTTAILGDVASMATAIATTNPVAITSSALSGATNMVNRQEMLKNAENNVSNPPAFLGTALAPHFNQRFWQLTIMKEVTNYNEVRADLGYPCNVYKPVQIPTSGYIQIQNCDVKTTGEVPLWAISEINNMFNGGVKFG